MANSSVLDDYPDLTNASEPFNISELLGLINATILNVPSVASLNVTSAASLNVTSVASPARGSGLFGWAIKVVYMIGILGNAAAIVALRTGERRVRNRKHLLLLTSLAANDLVALVGMLCAMVVGDHVPAVKGTRLFCASRVVLRVFGIGSVCIAVTMALERYLALTRPFLYQKRVTYLKICMVLLVSWFSVAVLTCMPVMGLGIYYDEKQAECVRYRLAYTTKDFSYAVFYVVFGSLLCLVLVYCNVAVILALYAIRAPRAGSGGPVVRRVSRSSCRQRERCINSGSANMQALHHNAATAEEVAFSRLMATLSVLFMICWLPQMITSALFLSWGPLSWKGLTPAANASDVMMLLNYVLNPLLYVLIRRRRPLGSLCHSVASCFKRGHKASTESMSLKTSCCPQETLVVSDSSGAELRPLRALPPSDLPTAMLLKIDN